MSKAVLVLPKMPERCADCILIDLGDYGRDYCAKTERCVHDTNKRPDWCRLRPMPEKELLKEICYSNFENGYKAGWNKAIEAIEGSGE